MVHRVHHHVADGGTTAAPAGLPRLAQGDVLVILVPHLSHRGHALEEDQTELAAEHTDEGVLALLRHQLGRRPRRTHQLGAPPRLELEVMDDRSHRDVLQLQGVARGDVGLGTGTVVVVA